MRNGNKTWEGLSWTSFIISLVPIIMGFHKMYVYRNSEYFTSRNVNAYVGGDAYNYIINGNYATAFFVLAAVFVIMGIGFAVLYYLSKIDNSLAPLALGTAADPSVTSDELPDL